MFVDHQNMAGASLPSAPMTKTLAELSKRLQQLCEQAVHETDPEKQAVLSAEIYRVVAERDRIRGTIPTAQENASPS